MAEGVVGARAAAAGLEVVVDSAGTGGWHLGDPPHPQAVAAARARGYDIARQRARQVRPEDHRDFDLILAMDHANLGTLRRLAPADATARLRLMDEAGGRDVPDPYGEGEAAYEHALDLIEAAAGRLVEELRRGA
jgi:protein-tyrosine phosphatase